MNVISFGNSSLYVLGIEVILLLVISKHTASKLSLIDVPIINPSNKRELKTYMLNIPIDQMNNLKPIREHILERLGKNVVSFDLNFYMGYFLGRRADLGKTKT